MGFKKAAYGDERKVGEMFVIDRVELILLNETEQVRKLHCNDAVRFDSNAQPFDKVIERGNVRQNVIAEEEIGRFSGFDQLPGRGGAKEGRDRLHATLLRGARAVSRRFDTENGDAARDKILQEVSVITRNFGDVTRGADLIPVDPFIHVTATVRAPSAGERGEMSGGAA